jgi:site-specific DNA-cytosine methylase
VALEQLASIGYEAQPVLCKADEFGLPQARRRLFISCYNTKSNKLRQDADFDVTMAKLVASLKACRANHPCLRQVVLVADDDRVHSELMRRTNVAAHANDSSAASKQAWPQDYSEFLLHKGIRQSTLRAAPQALASPWFAVLGSREQQVLAFAQLDAGVEVDLHFWA